MEKDEVIVEVDSNECKKRKDAFSKKQISIEDLPIDMNPNVEGFSVLPDYVTPEEQIAIENMLERNGWIENAHCRRIQHFGYHAEYIGGQITHQQYLGDLPEEVMPALNRLIEQKKISALPNQILVCEYIPGHGIGFHIDRTDLFDEEVFCISLGREIRFKLRHPEMEETEGGLIVTWLGKGSVYIMKSEARYTWQHGISRNWKLKKEYDADPNNPKWERRIALTFRTVKTITSSTVCTIQDSNSSENILTIEQQEEKKRVQNILKRTIFVRRPIHIEVLSKNQIQEIKEEFISQILEELGYSKEHMEENQETTQKSFSHFGYKQGGDPGFTIQIPTNNLDSLKKDGENTISAIDLILEKKNLYCTKTIDVKYIK